MSKKNALVFGAGGFIGHHMVNRLKSEDFFVVGVDLKKPLFSKTKADIYHLSDLRDYKNYKKIFSEVRKFDELYQLAADMGGAGYIFTGKHDFEIMENSAYINLNALKAVATYKVGKIFFSSSACIYPARNQTDPSNPKCSEDSAYPADPDSEYGWEKIFSERLYLAANKNLGINIKIARFHNIFGPEGTWQGGREKAPAAICRKIAATKDNQIEIWGDGKQTRSFLYIDECIEGVRRLMNQEAFTGPVNMGSEEMVSINQMAEIVAKIAGKKIKIKHIKGPLGVRGRNSDNKLLKEKLLWEPKTTLTEGLTKTYHWIASQIKE